MDTRAISRIIPFMEKGKWYTCKDFTNYRAMGIHGPRKYSTVSGILSEASKNLPDVIVRRLRSREPRRNNRSIFEYSLAPSYQPKALFLPHGMMVKSGTPITPEITSYLESFTEVLEDKKMKEVLVTLEVGTKITCYNFTLDGFSASDGHKRVDTILGRLHTQFPGVLRRSALKVKVPGFEEPVYEYSLWEGEEPSPQSELDLSTPQPENVENPSVPLETSSDTTEERALSRLAEFKEKMEKSFAEMEEAIRQDLKGVSNGN